MFLTKDELLSTYYKTADPIDPDKQDLYLMRANAWCAGYIGGLPPSLPGDPCNVNLKTAVALCFELMARYETHQINSETGNITEVAPPTAVGELDESELFNPVKEILRPYKLAYENSTAAISDRSVRFL